MKRFAIFSYSYYYPQGGMNDFYKSFDTLEEAINCCEEKLNLKGENLNRIVRQCSYGCDIWDMVENKKVWDIYGQNCYQKIKP